MKKSIYIMTASALILSACSAATDSAEKGMESAKKVASEAAAKVNMDAKLEAILAAQADKAKTRFDARNPKETLKFFGIKEGMTVVEALPGGGWYSKILIPYLGDSGHLIGVDYSLRMWPEFGGFANEEFIEKKKTWAVDWVEGAQEWRAGSNANLSAFTFENRDTSLDGTVDAVLYIRAMHNLSRFQAEGDYMTKAMEDTYALLKPGGVVGIVQHQGPEGNDDSWAIGSNGYLKKSNFIASIQAAGFELVKESAINENPRDVPTNEESVWRLPPTLGGSKDNPEMRAKMQAIGESNRMTLLFKKI